MEEIDRLAQSINEYLIDREFFTNECNHIFLAEIIEDFYGWMSGANLDMDFQSKAELKISLRNFIENIR